MGRVSWGDKIVEYAKVGSKIKSDSEYRYVG